MEDCNAEKICEQKFLGLEEKIKVVNHRIGDLEMRSEEINNIKNVLIELQLLTKLQREDSIKRDIAIENMNKTQVEITNTLKTLSENLNKTDKNVEKLNEKVEKTNDELNKKIGEMNKDNNISVGSIVKYAAFGFLGSGITLAIAQLTKLLK